MLSTLAIWGRIRDRKFKRLPNVYDHCVVTAARTVVIFHMTTDKYPDPITDSKNVPVLHFHILSTLDLSRHRKFEMLPIVLGH